ncbi:S-adenosyl-L-methionine-dependent methyltransferase [Parathielavia appendiculata]|uniref:DNA (cytosine-5-)-methyltransferase n=1 Tax=Parathielavia appendiculata TaxID=2587402 RepID=A0AAN6Z565_9PEZI|nr:S-adenosyl-L-methionine-dependent methyltransferase [Parathielavia appendiculata]
MAGFLEAQYGVSAERLHPVVIDDSDDYLSREERTENELSEIIDLTYDDIPAPIVARPAQIVPARELESYRLPSGLLIKPERTIELRTALGQHQIQFLRVKAIVTQGWDSDIVIRGLGFTRTRQLDGMLSQKLNEVALVAELRSPGRMGWEEDALLDVKPNDIRGKRELRVTNAPFPDHRFDPTDVESMGEDWVERYCPLVCRYRYEIHYHGNCDKPFEWALVKIGEDEADPGYRMKDSQNLNKWRGGKVPGGSHKPGGSSLPVFDLEAQGQRPVPSSLSPGQKYTAGDVFAGAGGASRGMERAGVKLKFAVDHWEHAAASLRSNFPHARVYDMDVIDFIHSKETTCSVDILHLSPPCQFWSPAHTVAGKNDKDNRAALFSCRELIGKFRPRIFTVEQTFGILCSRFRKEFNMFLNGFTDWGYSVRWKVVPLANYGVPQLRKRLIMIGSCPGEKLPPFPPPTHSKDGAGGLRPWATPQSVLAPLESRRFVHRLHTPKGIKRWDPPKPRWDPTKLAKTITTNGGQNYHWDGHRDFTLLEYAVLQGFPKWHRFEGSCIKKQIGNAFAPSVVRVLYSHLVDWLLAQDGFSPSDRHRARSAIPLFRGPTSPDVIVPRRCPSSSRSRRNSFRRHSEVVQRLNWAAKEADQHPDPMDLDGIEELSDTETRDEDESSQDAADDEVNIGVIDLTMDVGKGWEEDPHVLSD